MEGKYLRTSIYMFLIQLFESLNMSSRMSQAEHRNLEFQ